MVSHGVYTGARLNIGLIIPVNALLRDQTQRRTLLEGGGGRNKIANPRTGLEGFTVMGILPWPSTKLMGPMRTAAAVRKRKKEKENK